MADEPNVATLLKRARRACEDSATMSDEIAKMLVETRRLIASAAGVYPPPRTRG